MPRRSLPQVTVPVPCHVDWNGMMRIDREGLVRFCDSCDKPVYDSRSMTRRQLQDLITTHEGPGRCLRLHVRPDGTVVTRDCFAPLLRLGRFLWLKTALLAVTFWAAVLGLRPVVPRISRYLSEPRESVPEPRETHVIQGLVGSRYRPAPATQVARTRAARAVAAATPRGGCWSHAGRLRPAVADGRGAPAAQAGRRYGPGLARVSRDRARGQGRPWAMSLRIPVRTPKERRPDTG